MRGLFDTDGSLKFSKLNKEFNYYPRIQFAFKNSDFSLKLGLLFEKLGYNYSRWYEKRSNQWYYQISGKENLKKWEKEVGFSNPVHYTKFLYWEKFGYYIQKSSLNFRLKALNLKIEGCF